MTVIEGAINSGLPIVYAFMVFFHFPSILRIYLIIHFINGTQLLILYDVSYIALKIVHKVFVLYVPFPQDYGQVHISSQWWR